MRISTCMASRTLAKACARLDRGAVCIGSIFGVSRSSRCPSGAEPVQDRPKTNCNGLTGERDLSRRWVVPGGQWRPTFAVTEGSLERLTRFAGEAGMVAEEKSQGVVSCIGVFACSHASARRPRGL